jgi:hypothetical protein
MKSEKGGAMSSQPTMSEDRVKTIEITLDKDGTPQVPEGQGTVFVDSMKDEEVIWVAKFPFRIDFKEGTPFYEDQFNQNHRRSGLVRRGVLASRVRYYKYTIEVNGKELDPKILVFPGSN